MTALENPIWSALSGRQIDLSEGDSRARRYKSIYTILAGMPEYDAEGFRTLADVLDTGATVGVCSVKPFNESTIAAAGLQNGGFFDVAQMFCENLLDAKPASDPELNSICVLNDHDVAEMTALASLTQPGPFASRTIDFGTFVGIKSGGKLVAMAGERMKVGVDLDEVSAVCTHPDFQGKGLARTLVHRVASNIIERCHKPFLHVRADNAPAIKSYQNLGFVQVRQMHFALLTKN